MLTVTEKVKIIMKRKGVTITDLAEKTGQTRQNLHNKLSRDNFTINQLIDISRALNCSLDMIFTDTDTGEQI